MGADLAGALADGGIHLYRRRVQFQLLAERLLGLVHGTLDGLVPGLVGRVVGIVLQSVVVGLDRAGQAVHRQGQFGLLALQVDGRRPQAVNADLQFKQPAGCVADFGPVGGGAAVPPGVAGGFQRYLLAGDGAPHDVGHHLAAVGVGDGDHIPGARQDAAGGQHADLQRGVTDCAGLHHVQRPVRRGGQHLPGHAHQHVVGAGHRRTEGQFLPDGLRHRFQLRLAVGGQQQVALQHQRIGAGGIGRVHDPHIGVRLADLHLLDQRRAVLLVGQRALQVRLLLELHPVQLALRRAQDAVGQAHIAGAHRGGGADHLIAAGHIPRKLEPAVRRHAGEPAERLARPLDDLPPGDAVAVKKLHLVVCIGQAIHGAVHKLDAADLAGGSHKVGNRHWEVGLVVPQPGRKILVKTDHPVVGVQPVDVGACLCGLLGHEDAHRRLAAQVCVEAGQGKLLARLNLHRVMRRPQFDLCAGRAGRPRAQVGLVVALLGESDAADLSIGLIAAAQHKPAGQQHDFVLDDGSSPPSIE